MYTWANGDRYEGQWDGDKRNGKGTKHFANGDKYEGEWVDGQMTGPRCAHVGEWLSS